MQHSLEKLKTGLVIFWAMWFSMATLTNFMDLLTHLSLLPEHFSFASHNENLMKGIMSLYHLPDSVVLFAFILIITYEFIITCTFWIAAVGFLKSLPSRMALVNRAFTLSIALWAAFMVGEEIFIAYAFEGVHLDLLVAQLICLMAIHLLPSSS